MMDQSNAIPLHGGQLRQISERFNKPVAQLIDFSANINPDGPPATVVLSLRTGLDDLSMLTTYPDLQQTELKQAIAEYCDLHPRNLVVANGFVPLLECTLRTLKIKRCLLPVPAFVEYRRSLTRAGVKVEPHILSAASNFRYNLAPLVDGQHDAILLANPQNPSGTLTRKETLRQLVSKCAEQQISVLVDEAFIDYTPLDSITGDVNRFVNLVVFRSVTKFHGIPGLRVAYAAANQGVAQAIDENLPPWPITTLASRAAANALQDNHFAEHSRILNNRRKSELVSGLAALGTESFPSAANFLLIRLPGTISVEQFWKRMIVEHNIVLRDCSNYEGLAAGYLRVAVRTERENHQLLHAFSLTLPSRTQRIK